MDPWHSADVDATSSAAQPPHLDDGIYARPARRRLAREIERMFRRPPPPAAPRPLGAAAAPAAPKATAPTGSRRTRRRDSGTRVPSRAASGDDGSGGGDPEHLPPDALTQIGLIAGSPGAEMRFKCIFGDKTRKDEFPTVEFAGRLDGGDNDSLELADRLAHLNALGYNVYIFAQPTEDIGRRWFAHDGDVTGVRVLFVDADEAPFPTEWHHAPSFTLRHPTTGRWWAFWLVDPTEWPVEMLKDVQLQLAARYGTDPSVSNPSRVVRLAGYARWKDGEDCGPYDLTRGTGEVVGFLDMFAGLPPPPERKPPAPRQRDDFVSEERLRFLLSRVDPGCQRLQWLAVIGAVRDATILDPDGDPLGFDANVETACAWSRGDLGSFGAPPNWEGDDDVVHTLDTLTRGDADAG